jgi:hypothetical protein
MDALQTEWAALTAQYPADTTQQRLDRLNATKVAGPRRDVQVSEVIGYLELNLKMDALLNYAAAAPTTGGTQAQIAARNLAREFQLMQSPPFGTSDPTIYATLSAALNAIASDSASGVTLADAVAMLALANTQILWWQANGYSGPLTMAYLTAETPPLT